MRRGEPGRLQWREDEEVGAGIWTRIVCSDSGFQIYSKKKKYDRENAITLLPACLLYFTLSQRNGPIPLLGPRV